MCGKGRDSWRHAEVHAAAAAAAELRTFPCFPWTLRHARRHISCLQLPHAAGCCWCPARPPDHPVLCAGFGALIVTDVFGQATNFTDTVSIHIKPAATPVINDGMAEVSALPGTSPVFNSNGTSCPTGNCSSLWALSCPNSRGSFANRTGDSITVAIGRNSSYDVNAASASGPFNCSLTMTVVDPDGLAASTSLILTVVPSPPDCTLAVFSPSILASRTNSQVCSAIKVSAWGRRSRASYTSRAVQPNHMGDASPWPAPGLG